MIVTQNLLIDKWNAVRREGSGFQQVDPDHPLEWYAGSSDIGKMTLLLITNERGPKLASSRSIEIAQRLRPDNRWTITFDLLREDQKSVFALLCADLIEYSRSVESESEGIKRAANRYKQWNLLMEKQKSPLLSEASQKGLIGELLLMEYLHEMMGFTMEAIISAWQEPEYSDQDFRFAESWYEVKTTGVASVSVTISSVEQLDSDIDSDIDGHLAVYRIDKCNADNPQSITLIQAVGRARALIENNSDLLTAFESKLFNYGFIDAPDYGQQHYKVSGLDFYTVNESFPRILRQQLPTAILNTVYSLDIAAIDPWKE